MNIMSDFYGLVTPKQLLNSDQSHFNPVSCEKAKVSKPSEIGISESHTQTFSPRDCSVFVVDMHLWKLKHGPIVFSVGSKIEHPNLFGRGSVALNTSPS